MTACLHCEGAGDVSTTSGEIEPCGWCGGAGRLLLCASCGVAYPNAEDDFGIINGFCAECSRDLKPRPDDTWQDKPADQPLDYEKARELSNRLFAWAKLEADELSSASESSLASALAGGADCIDALVLENRHLQTALRRALTAV